MVTPFAPHVQGTGTIQPRARPPGIVPESVMSSAATVVGGYDLNLRCLPWSAQAEHDELPHDDAQGRRRRGLS